MGLPTIAPYAMPGEAQLPTNRVGWRPRPERAVLLVHDMQNHFLRPFRQDQAPVVELKDNINALRRACAELSIPVVYTAQPGGQSTQERGLQLDMWGTGIGSEPADAAIDAALTPGEKDIQLTKWRYNAFYRTDLDDVLDQHGRDQLIITGIYAHIGCLMTAAAAFMQDIQAFVVADAMADFSRADHEMALTYAAGRCAVTATTDRLIQQLHGESR